VEDVESGACVEPVDDSPSALSIGFCCAIFVCLFLSVSRKFGEKRKEGSYNL